MIRLPNSIRTSIQAKLFSSFLGVLLLLVAVVAVSFAIIGRLGKASEQILKMNYNSIIASIRMIDELESMQREYIISYGAGNISREKMLRAQNSFSEWLGRAKDNITEAGEAGIVAELDSQYAAYLKALGGAASATGIPAAPVAATEAQYQRIRQGCQRLLQVNQNAMFVKSDAAQRIAKQGSRFLILITAWVLLFGVILSWGLSRRIVMPIVKLKEATQSLAAGDYSVELSGGGEDELGILMNEFNAMATKLREFNDLNLRTILTEQQKSGAILANIQDGILFVGVDYFIEDVNAAALDAFQLSRAEVVGRHFLEIIKQDRLFADLKRCLETRRRLDYDGRENIIALRHNDRQTYLEYFFSPVLSPQNELLGALFLLRDVTKLKELDRLKSEFVMIASHELKTPLTSLNMSLDLLRESLQASDRYRDLELVDIAKEETNRLRALVNDLLDLSKIEAGKIEMHFSAVAPSAMLEAVSQYFKGQSAEKDAVWVTVCPPDLPAVWCDEEKLLLVFGNLAGNALKAINPGGRIRISAEKSGGFVMFCVQDDGIGIPLAYQNKIFDRFVQVEEQKAPRGTGLGLTISREIVRAHGGSIWVESTPGKGASFYFTIPIEPSPLEQLKAR